MIQHVMATWRCRHFWLSLVHLDLRNRYRRSVLGIGWSLLHPLAMTVVFCIAFGGILGSQDWRSFAPKLLVGLAIWDFMKSSIIFGCDAFIRGEAYIRQCPLPMSIYSLRIVLGTFIHFLIALALVVVALITLTGTPDALYALPTILPTIAMLSVFCWSIATLAAFAHAYFHDTKHLIEVVSQLLFFLTPIMYPPGLLEAKGLGWIVEINPVAHFIVLIGQPLMEGKIPAPEQYLYAGGLTVALFGLACGAMAWLQKRLIFQL